MTRRMPVALGLALLFVAPAASHAASPRPDLRSEQAGAPCVRPVVPTSASCTFNVWGHVSDPDGVVHGASVRDGSRTVTTNERGFFDLYVPGPGSYLVWIESRPGCKVPLRVDIDPVAAVREGGVRRDVRLPCTRPTYNAFGFAVVQKGALVTVARNGLTHSGQAPGRLEWLELRDGERRKPRSFVNTAHDDRDAAGGLTRSGALMVFWAHFDIDANRWAGMRYVRAARDGSVEGVIGTGSLVSYSPYGPLVVLPSGRLMQTFYGTDGRVDRVYTSFSGDDGRTWSPIAPIDLWPSFRANEAAAVYLDGDSDDRARLLMVARADGWSRGRHWYGLVQYSSGDGGRTWKRHGVIPVTRSGRESVPWVATLTGGRIAMVWADRGTLTLKRSIVRFNDALSMRWRSGSVIYRSKVPYSPHPNVGDFGYPSIAAYGPADTQRVIVFNDVNPAGCVGYLVDVDMVAMPLWGSESERPVAVSP